MKETKLFELVTGTETKPWLSRNMLPNINTCENGWLNFSANRRVVSLKSLELIQFAWPTLSIYFKFLCAVPSDDVIESPLFLMRPPVIIPPWPYLVGQLCWLDHFSAVSSLFFYGFSLKKIFYLSYWLRLLLIVCGDIESNPGQGSDRRVRVLYSNIRGLHANLDELAVAG